MKNLYVVHKNVKLGKNVHIEPFCIIGKPPKGRKENESKLEIGEGTLIRAYSIIYSGSKIGDFLTTGIAVSIRENNVIGNKVVIGTRSIIEFGNKIGNNVRIHSGCFMEMATIEDDVIIAPGVFLTDDLHPPCPRFKDCVGGVHIAMGAKIGACATLLPGVKVGKGAVIGAGSVVVKDVPANVVVAGNPAKVIKYVHDLTCKKKFFKRPYDWEKIIRKAYSRF